MAKNRNIAAALPLVALGALRKLGEDIAIARARRSESRAEWARRIGVSVPTLIRLEKGDPNVSMATYASALWLIGRAQALADLAAPEHDVGALEAAVRKAQARGRKFATSSQPVRFGSGKGGRP